MSYSPADATHPSNLIPSITYTPWGAEQTLEDGCVGSGCTNALETYVYNNRLQPVTIELGSTSNPSADYSLAYNYAASGAPCSITQGAGDNGNVTGYTYTDNVNPGLSHTATYCYDAVNRLLWATATGNTTYIVNFSYDPYGNRSCMTSGPPGPTGSSADTLYCFSAVKYSSATNQITTPGYSYDGCSPLMF